jgi:hypothetical protein
VDDERASILATIGLSLAILSYTAGIVTVCWPYLFTLEFETLGDQFDYLDTVFRIGCATTLVLNTAAIVLGKWSLAKGADWRARWAIRLGAFGYLGSLLLMVPAGTCATV